jgi:hypothetical protein
VLLPDSVRGDSGDSSDRDNFSGGSECGLDKVVHCFSLVAVGLVSKAQEEESWR